jgi:uncharacterized protein YegL
MIKRHMRALVAAVAVGVVAVGTGVFVADAAASDPSVSGAKQFDGAEAPDAILCAGSVDVKVTLTGTAGVDGTATDVMLVLDLSGSISGTDITQLKAAAKDVVDALDVGQLALGNRVGVVTYRGTVVAPTLTTTAPGTDAVALKAAIDAVVFGGGSPHGAGINAAASALATSTNARAMVILTDGLNVQDNPSGAATTAKNAGITIATIGIGGDAASTVLEGWASDDSYYQPGTPGPINKDKLVTNIGAAVAVPASFTLTETLASSFTASDVSGGTVSGDGKTVTATGSLDSGDTATLTYTATRNGSDPSVVTEETVSSSTLTLTDGTGSVTPASLSIEVLPCDADELLDQETCTGSTCNAGGTTDGGVVYAVNAGAPAAGTEIFVASLTSTPPAGACPGFDGNTNGVQFDIRPLTTAGTFEIRIPKATLGSKKWWQTDVCVGTNLRFITKIGSLANLRPGATETADRWWGLLPSVKRYTLVNGKLVAGPWITKRTVNSAGDAIIRFTMPYVTGSESVTTNGAAAYDPKVFGG